MVKSKILHNKKGAFTAMSDTLASFFQLFTGDHSFYMGKLKHADIFIGEDHYKARGKMLDLNNIYECFRLSLEDDLENEKSLVLRRMTKRFLDKHPQFAGLQRREYELFKELKMDENPNLVKLIDYIEEEDSLISEFIPGMPLDLFVKREPEYYFKRKTTLKMLKQLVSAVGFLHEQGMCHLDISPSCIFVKENADHDIVLLNNGLAIATYDKIPLGKLEGQDLPPELQEGQPYDCRTDIWQLGQIIKLMIDVRRHDPNRSSNHLKLIAMRCMQQKKEERYQNVQDILSDLETWERLYDSTGTNR